MAVTLVGASGASYYYEPYEINGDWNNVPGNYAFSYPTIGGWKILYIGETKSFNSRFPQHERWPEALRHNATHILVRLNRFGEANRQAEERDLIEAYHPVLNTQHRLPLIDILGMVSRFDRG